MNSLPLLVALPLAALCGAIILSDLRLMRIPDWIALSLVALFATWMVADFGSIPILPRLMVAGVMFIICFALFAARLMGGGDTKVIPALALFIPPIHLSAVMLLFSACLLVSIIGIVSVRRSSFTSNVSWTVFHSHKLPMGVAIGSTGLIALGMA